MKMMKRSKVVIACLMMSLVGCQTLTNQDIGTVTGGVAGGLLGSQFGSGNGQLLAVGIGTLAGAYIGGAIGKSMDATDRLKAERALETTKAGQVTEWQNPDTGARYKVVPKKARKHQSRYCREYTMTATIAGKNQQTYGTACRQPDGSWKVQN